MPDEPLHDLLAGVNSNDHF